MQVFHTNTQNARSVAPCQGHDPSVPDEDLERDRVLDLFRQYPSPVIEHMAVLAAQVLHERERAA